MKFKNTLTEEATAGKDMINTLARALVGKKFMEIGAVLKSIGFKDKDYSLSTESPMPPAWIIKHRSKKIVIVNKKNAEKPEKIVGDLAIGYL